MMHSHNHQNTATAVESGRPPLDKAGLQGGGHGLFGIHVSPSRLVVDLWRHGQILMLAFIFVATTAQIWCDKASRKNAEGNALYEQKNFPAALDKYVEANDGKAHRQELAYNLANAFYQQKKYQEALKELEKALASGNSSLNEKIHFNRGNTFFQMGKYQEAIEAYKKTLELDPSDKEAKHNLELALRKLQENPQEQQKDSKNKDQQSKQDKQEKQNQKQDRSQDKQKQQQSSPPKDQQQPSQNANSKPGQDQKPNQTAQPQKAGMDPKEALRILDALNQQEKQEQRKQALKIQRERVGGKDW
jgi:tetratricopeptide (TPR) repeat protein